MAETPVPEMVHRVAKAISGAPFPSPASYKKARAAIEAMREPNLEMRKTCGFIDAEVTWPAMIDAALSSPAPTEEG